MITIAIANQKGGVGKTTTAVSLSSALVRQGYRLLLVDLDAQAGATRWLTGDYGPEGAVVHDVLLGRKAIHEVILRTRVGFDLVPSHLGLSDLDLKLALKAHSDGRLAQALSEVARSYDYCLIDCPPWLGIAALNAFAAANYVLIPIDCRAESFETVKLLSEHMDDTARAYRRPIGIYALPTFYERTNLARGVHKKIEAKFPDVTLPVVHRNVALAEAYAMRQTIYEHAPTSSGAVDYVRVAKELAEDLGATQGTIRKGATRP